MKTIRIPKTPASAYDDTRPASDLLRAHVENLEKAIHPRKKSAVTAGLSEGDAARYIRELARQLHQKHLLPDIAPGPTIGQRPGKAAPRAPRASRGTSRTSRPAARAARPASRASGRKVR